MSKKLQNMAVNVKNNLSLVQQEKLSEAVHQFLILRKRLQNKENLFVFFYFCMCVIIFGAIGVRFV